MSSDNVINFGSIKQAALVRKLEDLTKMAKEGHLTGFVGVGYVDSEVDLVLEVGDFDVDSLISGLSIVKAVFVNAEAGEVEISDD